jgi:hypothetical protein
VCAADLPEGAGASMRIGFERAPGYGSDLRAILTGPPCGFALRGVPLFL